MVSMEIAMANLSEPAFGWGGCSLAHVGAMSKNNRRSEKMKLYLALSMEPLTSRQPRETRKNSLLPPPPVGEWMMRRMLVSLHLIVSFLDQHLQFGLT
jgi:hypothetical protein